MVENNQCVKGTCITAERLWKNYGAHINILQAQHALFHPGERQTYGRQADREADEWTEETEGKRGVSK